MEHTNHQNPHCMKNLNHLVEMEHLACLGAVTAWPQGILDRTHRGDFISDATTTTAHIRDAAEH